MSVCERPGPAALLLHLQPVCRPHLLPPPDHRLPPLLALLSDLVLTLLALSPALYTYYRQRASSMTYWNVDRYFVSSCLVFGVALYSKAHTGYGLFSGVALFCLLLLSQALWLLQNVPKFFGIDNALNLYLSKEVVIRNEFISNLFSTKYVFGPSPEFEFLSESDGRFCVLLFVLFLSFQIVSLIHPLAFLTFMSYWFLVLATTFTLTKLLCQTFLYGKIERNKRYMISFNTYLMGAFALVSFVLYFIEITEERWRLAVLLLGVSGFSCFLTFELMIPVEKRWTFCPAMMPQWFLYIVFYSAPRNAVYPNPIPNTVDFRTFVSNCMLDMWTLNPFGSFLVSLNFVFHWILLLLLSWFQVRTTQMLPLLVTYSFLAFLMQRSNFRIVSGLFTVLFYWLETTYPLSRSSFIFFSGYLFVLRLFDSSFFLGSGKTTFNRWIFTLYAFILFSSSLFKLFGHTEMHHVLFIQVLISCRRLSQRLLHKSLNLQELILFFVVSMRTALVLPYCSLPLFAMNITITTTNVLWYIGIPIRLVVILYCISLSNGIDFYFIFSTWLAIALLKRVISHDLYGARFPLIITVSLLSMFIVSRYTYHIDAGSTYEYDLMFSTLKSVRSIMYSLI